MTSRNAAALEQKALAFCREHALFSPGDRVLAAVSGGADSMALLALLTALQGTLGITVRAAHYHHGLRGSEADRDEAFVRAWCEANGVPCVFGRGDVAARAAQTGESLETAARALRYGFLERCEADRIATAHTASDNLETVLLHLLRGAGTRGFAGIPPKRGRIVRPLLECTREELLSYLDARGIGHVEDGSNGQDNCLRNRLRHRVLPLLEAENPRLYETVCRSCALVRAEDAYLSKLAREAADRCRAQDGWRCEALAALEPVLRRRVLLAMLCELPLSSPRAADVAVLEELLQGDGPARRTLPEGWDARRDYGILRIARPEAADAWAEQPLQIPGVTVLPEAGWRIRAEVTENSNFSAKNRYTFALRYDMIAAAWSVRPRKEGDALLLPAGHRTLKRLMIDRRVPAPMRSRLPVVCCGGRAAAVLGLARSEDFAPKPGRPALVLTLEALPREAARESISEGELH